MRCIARALSICAALFTLGILPTVWAQSSAAAASAARPVSEFDGVGAAAERAVQQGSGEGALPAKLAEEELKGHVAHRQWQRQFARESWEWHLFSTRLLMFVVLAIVGCGLWFTYIQFTRETASSVPARQNIASGEAEAKADVSIGMKPTTVKIGPSGLEVTSQVIGLLVLGFSLAFFYLYVKDVYPIQESQLRSHAEAAAAPAASQANR